MASPKEAVEELRAKGLDASETPGDGWPIDVSAEHRSAVEAKLDRRFEITNALETADGPPYLYSVEPTSANW